MLIVKMKIKCNSFSEYSQPESASWARLVLSAAWSFVRSSTDCRDKEAESPVLVVTQIYNPKQGGEK